jgi:hypothetical protein
MIERGTQVVTNFGTSPFRYDLKRKLARERRKITSIGKSSLPSPSTVNYYDSSDEVVGSSRLLPARPNLDLNDLLPPFLANLKLDASAESQAANVITQFSNTA